MEEFIYGIKLREILKQDNLLKFKKISMRKNKIKFYDIKEEILSKIKKNGGWVNCHAHIDRAFTITKENFKLANKFRHEKWKLNAELRRNSTIFQIYDRMAQATELFLSQGV